MAVRQAAVACPTFLKKMLDLLLRRERTDFFTYLL
jgi:hypothetical protein